MTATIAADTPDDRLLTMREAAEVTGQKQSKLAERFKAGRWPGGLMRDGKRHVPVRDLIDDGLLQRVTLASSGDTTAAEGRELTALRERVVRLEAEVEAADRRTAEAEARVAHLEKRTDQLIANLEHQRTAWQQQAELALETVRTLTGRGDQ